MRSYHRDDLIAAPASGMAPGAVAVIRTSGEGAADSLARIFSRPEALVQAAGHTLVHGKIRRNGRPVDEVVLGIYRAPRSYTGEDSVEIFCHGGLPVVEAVMEAVIQAGFRRAEPGEFTFRAFMNGKMDLTQAEAVQELVAAQTAEAGRLALQRLSGAVGRRMGRIRDLLKQIAAAAALDMDYPDEEADVPEAEDLPLGEIEAEVEALLATFGTGRLYQEGVTAVLAGATNAGKSSLFNLFLKEDRSIVSEVHGTTRDYLEASIDVRGVPVRLVDTAGLRVLPADGEEGAGRVEREGIRRSEQVMGTADVVFYVVDSRTGLTERDRGVLSDLGGQDGGRPVIGLWNKVDEEGAGEAPEGFVPVSAETGEGFPAVEEGLLQAVAGSAAVKPGAVGSAGTVIESRRQKEGLERVLAAVQLVRRGLAEGHSWDLVSVDLEEALAALGELTGEITSEEVLHAMFSRFCVGK